MHQLLDEMRRVHRRIHGAKRLYVMLDYDGTLTPIVKHPSLAKLQGETLETLRSLVALPKCTLAVVSGRSIPELQQLVPLERVYFLGNHGLEISGGKIAFSHPAAGQLGQSLQQVAASIETSLKQVKGVVLENKRLSLTVHYRMVSPKNVLRVRESVSLALSRQKKLKITNGKKIIEVRPRVNWDKGIACEWLIDSLGPGLPLYIGDDNTDEDAFYRLRRGITILVSKRRHPSRANYLAKDTLEVHSFLKSLIPLLT